MGAGSPPPALTGREDQERQFRTLLTRLGDVPRDVAIASKIVRALGFAPHEITGL